jgi:exportin-2 (importin alpha re-exporter)
MNLMKIFDILILPNISITPEDQEEFEDDPDAYIRNDLEESDTETRRRYCMKFVQ